MFSIIMPCVRFRVPDQLEAAIPTPVPVAWAVLCVTEAVPDELEAETEDGVDAVDPVAEADEADVTVDIPVAVELTADEVDTLWESEALLDVDSDKVETVLVADEEVAPADGPVTAELVVEEEAAVGEGVDALADSEAVDSVLASFAEFGVGFAIAALTWEFIAVSEADAVGTDREIEDAGEGLNAGMLDEDVANVVGVETVLDIALLEDVWTGVVGVAVMLTDTPLGAPKTGVDVPLNAAAVEALLWETKDSPVAATNV
jgi:hypothetical protein